MDYKQETALQECIAKDHKYYEFFMNIKVALRENHMT